MATSMPAPIRAGLLRSSARRNCRQAGDWASTASSSTTSFEYASGIPDSRIKPRVDQVDGKIDADEDERKQEHRCLDHRKIMVIERLDGEQADARPCKHSLGNHRAAEQQAKLHPAERHQRNTRVFQRVYSDHN